MSDLAINLPPDLITRLAQLVAVELQEQRRWTDIHGVANYLDITISQARYLRSIGMPAKKPGKRLLFDLREVDAWLESQ